MKKLLSSTLGVAAIALAASAAHATKPEPVELDQEVTPFETETTIDFGALSEGRSGVEVSCFVWREVCGDTGGGSSGGGGGGGGTPRGCSFPWGKPECGG